MARSFAFRPRYRGIAWAAVGVGGTLATLAATVLGVAIMPLATGAVGVVLGSAYLLSPTWGFTVVADDDGLTVRTPRAERFKLPWTDVVRVIASPTTHTCFVDSGNAATSLLVPGDGAPAPYDLADKAELYATIIAQVTKRAPDRVQIVDKLEAVR